MLRHLLIIAFWFTGWAHLVAQVPASSTNAPAATPPPETVAISDIISRSDATLAKLKDEQNKLTNDSVIQTLELRLPVLTEQIDTRLKQDKELFQSDPTLSDLQNSQSAWQAPAKELDAMKVTLSERASHNSALIDDLKPQTATWQATLVSAKAMSAPPEAIERITTVLSEIAATMQLAKASQSQILSIQTKVSDQDSRVQAGMGDVTKAQTSSQEALFHQDHPPLWSESLSSLATGHKVEENKSFHDQILSVQAYLSEKIAVLGLHLLIVVLLALNLYAMRKVLHARAEKDAALQNAERIFAHPFATAVLLSLLVSGWLYPLPPRLLWSIIGIIGLLPTLMILRRLSDPSLFPILYALVTAYFLDQIRHVLIPAGTYFRIFLILELLAGALFILWLFQSKRLSAQFVETRHEQWIRPFLHTTLWIFVFAGMANLFGYVKLSNLVGNGMLRSCYWTVVVYAAIRIVDALLLSALSIPPLSRFRTVEMNRSVIYSKAHQFINWMAVFLWFVGVLQFFSLREPVWYMGHRVVNHVIHWGSINFSLGDLAAFGLTVWASFLLSRFLRFILAEEIYPHLSLGRGIPYAASTMVHYTVLVAGFFAALGALGIDLSKFSILAGAFGVGLGFGLQNIMNNFVSGIILLFERPIKVGDTLQMDTATGVVESIGIRASVIRLSNGSSMIVPNGNLISAPVTNWSLTNNRRMIEIPVSINAKVDPQHIIELLLKVVGKNTEALNYPAPQALLTTLGGTALAFRLRLWVNAEADWMKVTSDITISINAALLKEGIAVS